MPPWTGGDRDTAMNTHHNTACLFQGSGIIVLMQMFDHSDLTYGSFSSDLYTQFSLPTQYVSGEFLSDSFSCSENVWVPPQNTMNGALVPLYRYVYVHIYFDGGVSDVRVQDLL